MEKLFAELRKRHPGYEVVDVRFTIDQREPCRKNPDLDAQMAKAVRKAKRVELSL